jgi:hypothetical protein
MDEMRYQRGVWGAVMYAYMLILLRFSDGHD